MSEVIENKEMVEAIGKAPLKYLFNYFDDIKDGLIIEFGVHVGNTGARLGARTVDLRRPVVLLRRRGSRARECWPDQGCHLAARRGHHDQAC